MTNRKTCGEAIVGLLEAYGVEVVFGIPGVHTLELYRGLVGSPIRHVLTRHEQGAGFMADGYARATGKPGVCFLITGPGVTNASTAIAQAYSDSIPMLVISSVNARASLGKGGGELHELPDQRGLMSGCTAWSATVREPAEFPELLARAFALFASERPRPVHIEVPIDLFPVPVEEDWTPAAAPGRPRPAEAEVAEAAAILGAAQSPVIVAGGGARHGAEAVRALAERLGAPVATTVAGIGILPTGHPLALGPVLTAKAGRTVVEGADAVLVLGSELSRVETWGPPLEFAGAFIRVDLDPGQLAARPCSLAIRADAGATAAAIAAALPGAADAVRLREVGDRVAAARAAAGAELGANERVHRAVIEDMVAKAPEGALFAGDMTLLAYTAGATIPLDGPGRFMFPAGYGTLGYALPAAIGAAIGRPDRAVVAMVGDHGLLYTVQEMATAADEGVGVVVVLWNNAALGAIRDGFISHGIEAIATSPSNPDFQGIARAFGWAAETVTDLGGVGAAVAAALASGRPTLVEVQAAEVDVPGSLS